MFRKKIKTNEVDYKLACRCCLKSDAEFYKLDSVTVARNIVSDDNNTLETGDNVERISLLRCLLYCIRTENSPELPQYICVGCSKSLQIAYYFMQNAVRAHDILCHELCSNKVPQPLRMNGQRKRSAETIKATTLKKKQEFPGKQMKYCTNDDDSIESANLPKTVRHECKICGAVIYNRLELKQHIRLHSDVISHSCKICNYVTVKMRQLDDHYSTVHGLTNAQIDKLEPVVSTTSRAKCTQVVPASNKIFNTNTAAVRTHGIDTATTSSTFRAIAQEDTGDTVCTLEDMELLIPTVLRPEDYTKPQTDDDDQLRDIEEQLAASMQATSTATQSASTVDLTEALSTLDLPQYINMDNTVIDVATTQPASNMTIGTEFLVLPDGSLQQVNDGGVVIEYINAANTNQSNKFSTATNSGKQNIAMQNLLATPPDESSLMGIDVNEIILDNTCLPHINTKPVQGPGLRLSAPMKYKCGLCPKSYATVTRLKSHQLTHSNLPKFYCDQCEFYSLRSLDLMMHYKTHHNIETGCVQLDAKSLATPADESKVFSCDMCLFETQSRGQLRSHYNKKHMMEPTEIQLRPSWDGGVPTASSASHDELNSNHKQQPDFPLGIKYPPAASSMAEQTPTASTTTPVGKNNASDGMSFLFETDTNNLPANENVNSIISSSAETATVSTDLPVNSNCNSFALYPENSTSLDRKIEPMEPLSTTPNASVFGDMQEFIDNTDVAAICTIPAEDMPVADGDDIVIDNNNISLDFDAENLFEDFEEEAENDDENENTDSATDQNLLLTSDDDVDDFDDEQSKNLQKPYCIFCNKKFTSQYKFENHMFSHRGLAPYRCELCTNIYNMKRLLIRHYKTVHKRMPTRDMVQAKGDKELVAPSNIEKLHIDMDRPPGFMCSKCPFECNRESEIRRHIGSHHGINDTASRHAFEMFIIRKLPFECPRCIRTFAAKRHLTRHLQRSHLVDTIIETQSSKMATSIATTSTTPTPTTALPNSNESVTNTISQVATTVEAMMEASEVTVGAVGCDDNARGKDDQHTKNYIKPGQTDLEINLHISTNSNANDLTTSPTQEIKSMIFSTPTPIDAFDFDYDFMGDAHANATTTTTVHDINDSFASTSSQSRNRVLNSDKLLTAALAHLETSPVKDLRNCLPRTPIYVCKKCNYTCDELAKFNKHQIDQHPNTESTQGRRKYEFECGICNSTYRTITLLRYHMKRHVKRNYKCEDCPKMFVLKLELDKHRAIHCSEMPYKCNINNCNKAFNYKHHLKRHQSATHFCKRYKCHIPNCGREFTTNSQLLQHIRGHRGLHAYKCPKCTRTYTRRKPLRIHAMRAHELDLTEDDLAEVYRKSMGYSNPHDMKIITRNGELLRRSVIEAAAKEQRSELSEAVVNIMK